MDHAEKKEQNLPPLHPLTYHTCSIHEYRKADLKTSDDWQKGFTLRISSSVKKLTASQQELVRQFPKAASSKLYCNVSTATFGQGLPPEGSWSRAVQFLILTLPERLKRTFQVFWAWLLSPLLCMSLQAPFISLHFRLGSWGLLLNWHLPPLQSVRVAMTPHRQPVGPSPAAVYRQERPRCVTQLAPIKDNVITAPIVPVYICWWEEIIDLSELEQGMLENYESESCLSQETCISKGFFSIAVLINGNLLLFLPISSCLHGNKRHGRCGGGGVGQGRDLLAKPEVNLPGALYATAATCSI